MSDGSGFEQVDTGSIAMDEARRRSLRAPAYHCDSSDDVEELVAELGLHTESNFFTAYSGGMADGGLFIQTYRPMQVGDSVRVELSLPSGYETQIRGRVAWVRQGGAGHDLTPGVGIVFDSLSRSDEEAIVHFMRLREPNFFDGHDFGYD